VSLLHIMQASSADQWVWLDETTMNLFEAQAVWGRRAGVELSCARTPRV
jgi:hypothetical protein